MTKAIKSKQSKLKHKNDNNNDIHYIKNDYNDNCNENHWN